MREPLAVCGSISIDVIDGRAPTIGGGAYHCARALRLLERPARIVAKCAPRDRAQLLPPLVGLGLPVTTVDSSRTAELELAYEGELRRISVRALADPWVPDEVATVSGSAWVHVAPLARSDFPRETIAALARGRRVSYDGQGLVRVAEHGPLRLDAEYDAELLRHISFLKLAEEEAAVVGDAATLPVEEVIVTLGSRGSIVHADGTATPVPCEPIRNVDVTGCGDAFAVGYLAARSDGVAPVAAARRATALVAMLLTARKRGR